MKSLRTTAMPLLFALTLILITFGCTGQKPDAWGARSMGWTGGDQPAGIGSARIDFGTWGDGAALVIWSDASSTSLGGGGMAGRELEPGETRQGVKYEGHLVGPGGQTVPLWCYTPDGTTGTVAIGEQNFDLAQGGLFLVSTRGGEVRVVQTQLAKLGLEPAGAHSMEDMSVDLLRQTAGSDADIGAFFRNGSRSE